MSLLSKNLHARRSASMFNDDQLIGFDFSLPRVYLSFYRRSEDSSLLATLYNRNLFFQTYIDMRFYLFHFSALHGKVQL